MQNNTRYTIKTALEQDPSLPAEVRRELLARLTADPAAPGPEDIDRLLSRAQVASLLNCSMRRVDQLSRDKHLARVIVPGNTQALGISARSVQSFIANRKGGEA